MLFYQVYKTSNITEYFRLTWNFDNHFSISHKIVHLNYNNITYESTRQILSKWTILQNLSVLTLYSSNILHSE